MTDLERRVLNIETAIGQINTAISNLATKRQQNHGYTLITNQITALKEELAEVKAQLTLLKK